MERLFSTCTRLHDILESLGLLNRFGGRYRDFQELNLDVSTEELLRTERALTYADLYAMLGNKDTVAWLTPHAAVASENVTVKYAWYHLNETCRFHFSADGQENLTAFARSPEHLLEIGDVVLRLLTASVVNSVVLGEWSCHHGALTITPTLPYFMEQCQSLKTLSLENFDMDEDQCRVLGTYSRPGLDIMLKCCKITNTGASALVEVLGRNQGPTKLDLCQIDNFVLANGLRGNSSLKSFMLRQSSSPDDGNREFLAIAAALKENKGLVVLDLWHNFRMSDEAWDAVCDSLKTHPALEVLNLYSAFTYATTAPAMLNSRIQALVKMLKMNMSIHTIHLERRYRQHEHFLFPYLETNKLRPRLLAIQRTRPIPYRSKVLGRALLSARNDANKFWMLVSGNAEVAFPSRTTTIAAAANLPTPVAATVTSIANVAAISAPVISDLTTTATVSRPVAALATATSATNPSAASDAFAFAPAAAADAVDVATPSADQKRKARP
jgi:hypothetical protein